MPVSGAGHVRRRFGHQRHAAGGARDPRPGRRSGGDRRRRMPSTSVAHEHEPQSGPARLHGAWGYGAANGIFAMHTAALHGDVWRQARGLRPARRGPAQNALLNPNALFKVPLTLEEYLTPALSPIRFTSYDCVYPCCGADAVVLASAKGRERLSVPKVRLLGGGEIHNYPANDIYALSAGWETFSRAQCTRKPMASGDIDFRATYDDYPVMEFIQLEAGASR